MGKMTFLFEHWDEMTKNYERFSKMAKISCPKECCLCCKIQHVSANSFEMIPIAEKIFELDLLDDTLKRIENYPEEHCVLLKDNQCSMYHLRPSLCRLFGLGKVKTKKDPYFLFSICRVIKENHPQIIETLSLKKGFENIKTFTQLHLPLLARIPEEQKNELPINEALKQALIKIAFYKSYET